jgi:hypothetical protein
MKPVKYHGEKESPFYRLQSKSKLAELLYVGVPKIKVIGKTDNLYFDFTKPKKDGTTRSISAPRDDLKAIQSRISDLLSRIAPPDYLFAPVSGRSYVDNAARHLGATSVHLLDIEDFFPSCTANKVVWFFMTRMGCSRDVTVLLKNIVTRNDALPQGSPCSPILAYLCYVDMWDDIDALVTAAGCLLSVYADDLTISGPVVPESLVWEIKKTLVKHGHRYKISKERSRHLKPTEITGTILSGNVLLAPNRQHKKISVVRRELAATTSLPHKEKLEAQLRGRVAQFKQITAPKPRSTTGAQISR